MRCRKGEDVLRSSIKAVAAWCTGIQDMYFGKEFIRQSFKSQQMIVGVPLVVGAGIAVSAQIERGLGTSPLVSSFHSDLHKAAQGEQ